MSAVGNSAEHHVGAGRHVGLAAADRLVETAADRRHGVGARDDDEIRVAARVAGGPDFAGRLFDWDHLLAGDVAAALGADLVFDVDRGDTRRLEILHRADDVDRVAVAGVGVGHHRNVDRARDVAGVGGHFGLGDEADVGQPQQGQRDVVAAHVGEFEAGFFRQSSRAAAS